MEQNSRIRIRGGSPSSYAYQLLLDVVAAPPATVVVVCPDDEVAEIFCQDLQAFSHVSEKQSPHTVFLPVGDPGPFSGAHPSLRTRRQRIRALLALRTGGTVVVTSLPALFRATLPAELFDSLCLTLRSEMDLGRDTLISRLTQAGYQRTDPVEDPGTFAVRGDIVDVYPVDAGKPYRIEFYGDFIERMRCFDPASQKTSGGALLGPVILTPAREVLLTEETYPRFREAVKSFADAHDIPRKVRDPYLEGTGIHIYPSESENWAPFAYGSHHATGHAAAYLKTPARWVWLDEALCLENFDGFLKEQAEERTRLPIAPLVSEHFVATSDSPAIRDMRESAWKFYDRLVLGDMSDMSDATSLRVEEIKIKEKTDLERLIEEGFTIDVFSSTQTQSDRLKYLLGEWGLTTGASIRFPVHSLSKGFVLRERKYAAFPDSDIVGGRKISAPTSDDDDATDFAESPDWSSVQSLSDLGVGDRIVHAKHGIGIYRGLVRLALTGGESDFLLLEYASEDKLYLPVYKLENLHKYIGGTSVTLDRLGGQQFQKTKDRVKDSLKKLAFDLVELYAKRSLQKGIPFQARDTEFRNFEAQFPYSETPDQLKAVDAIIRDTASGKMMDRLVCGDVGFGKTEVAIRAAFQAIHSGHQVAVLVPTTLLCFQHEISFRERFKNLPVRIESVSRFKSAKEQKATLEQAKLGQVDILIGTHRLLSRDVGFKSLGLLVIDEEHRFGVEHKEKIKTMKLDAHVLTLTATPIPRTLNMALSGLKEISLITTPPVNRLPIRTIVARYDEVMIKTAIQSELSRGGQVFYLHNRVDTIPRVVEKIRELVPESRVGVAHGQMGEDELEKVMRAFYEKEFNILICTTIIEAGLDISNANTLIVDNAHNLGLAQLYQIRGRVGRSDRRAYAYLFIPESGRVTEEARQRLEVIQRFIDLGSGFHIASHDMEIRGGGNLLGPEQSGHIAAIGFDLYTDLLAEAIREVQGKAEEISPARDPEIKTPFPAFLSEEYIPDVHQRLAMYRRLSAASGETLSALENEIQDRFGPLPIPATNLVWVIRIKNLLRKAGVDVLNVGKDRMAITSGPGNSIDPVKLVALVAGSPRIYQLLPDSKLVIQKAADSLTAIHSILEDSLRRLGVDVCI